MIYNVTLVSGVQQRNLLYKYKHPLFFRFFSYIDRYRVLSRVPTAMGPVILIIRADMKNINYLLNTAL